MRASLRWMQGLAVNTVVVSIVKGEIVQRGTRGWKWKCWVWIFNIATEIASILQLQLYTIQEPQFQVVSPNGYVCFTFLDNLRGETKQGKEWLQIEKEKGTLRFTCRRCRRMGVCWGSCCFWGRLCSKSDYSLPWFSVLGSFSSQAHWGCWLKEKTWTNKSSLDFFPAH